MPRPASLSLAMPSSTSAYSSNVTSPTDESSNLSSPRSTSVNNGATGQPTRYHRSSKSVAHDASVSYSRQQQPSSPEITSLPAFPESPKEPPRHAREASKGFFSNLKASKSSNKVQSVEPTIRQVSEDIPRSKINPQQESMYTLKRTTGSTPDLSLSNLDTGVSDERQGRQRDTDRGYVTNDEHSGRSIQRTEALGTSNASLDHSNAALSSTFPRKPKPKFSSLMTRTRSIRVDDAGRKSKPITPTSALGPGRRYHDEGINRADEFEAPPMTAPLAPDRPLRELMNSGARANSADRQGPNRSSDNIASRRAGLPGSSSASTSGLSGSTIVANPREGTGSQLLANIKSTSSKAADGLGRAGKGLLGKMNRRASSTAREEEGPYVCKVINLPLVEQTRKTRIAARLEDSKDKTEFWMPALPWRCIDYLNYKGCEELGLYRVPGSQTKVDHWAKRFDIEHDINIFDEPDAIVEELDINTIGSLFKRWLRELPDPILPKAVQTKVVAECTGSEKVPQLLKDELSKLPPWNYYLLFAVTCHMSLLLACQEKNRMGFHNLSVCFLPSMRMEAVCFKFLVQQWRDCWQGCYTEKEALEDEYRILNGRVSSSGESSRGSTALAEEKPSNGKLSSRAAQGRPSALNLTRAGDEAPPSTPARQLGEQNGHARTASNLPELEPVKPLSPLLSDY